ncbi:hypothetical protein C7S18_23350 [Ahniella affigens]|uniref:GGDEF domain-containing protein n=1 Tax=Ahniella affigens TaxID=2021234 RepID=A0A2P1PYL5_9GAMM|nr:EAL domain-containing protein [Ahniella affigens]AVP99931.1 hypothetical protein C7S18_23350 [Ahniella affigens]
MPNAPGRMFRVPLRFTAATLLVGLLWLLLLVMSGLAPAAIGSIDRLPLLLAALAFFGFAARRAKGREHLAWTCLTLAIAAILGGEISWAVAFFQSRSNPAFGVSDYFYLSYFPLITASILLLPKHLQSRAETVRFLLDAGIVVVGGGMLIWLLAIAPGLARQSDPRAGVVALAYAIGNLLTIVAAATMLLRLPIGSARQVYLFLGLSLLASLAGDLTWILQQLLSSDTTVPTWPRIFWFLQALLLVAAGEWHYRFHPDWSQAPIRRQASLPALPYLFLLIGYGLIAVMAWSGQLGTLRMLLVGGLVLTVFVVLRQALAHHLHSQLQVEQDRLASESKLAKLIENAAEGIAVLNANYRILYASPAVGRLLRLPVARLLDRSILEFLAPDDADSLRQSLAELGGITGRSSRKLMLRLLPQGSGMIWVEITMSDRRRDPELAGIVLNLRDVTEHHQLEDQMRFEALHDALTHLPNRDLFLDRVTRALSGAPVGQHGVLVLALTALRQINDSLGHSFGDQALILTAERLRQTLGTDTALARLNAEEFAALLDASVLDHRIDQIHAAFAEPLQLGQHRMPVSLDIGVALSRTGATAHELLRDADTACSRARDQHGPKRYELFAVEQHEQAMAWLALQSALPEAMAQGRFQVQLEPIIGLIDGFPFGLRPRLRWSDPARAAFPIERVREVIASGNPLGLKVAEWVISAAEREYASVLRFLPAAASLSLLTPVNGSLLLLGGLAERTQQRTDELGIPPVNLMFSVTETTLFSEGGQGFQRLRELRQVGARLALANFGGRGSSLAALQEPMFDTIVLARDLVARLGPGSRANALVRGVIAAAEAVGTRVIAAGVDSEAQKEFLIDQGCVYGLGQALSKAMPAEHLLPWLGGRYHEREAR